MTASCFRQLAIERLLRLLRSSPRGAVFNPWWQSDRANDIGPQASAIRRYQLRAYLSERIGRAELALVGEALGYRGGHFTGIAMTSERILLKGGSGDARCNVLSTIEPQRTSNPDKFPHGFSEPTAAIVWGALLRLGLAEDQFVLWNAFPWHSFDARAGMLSNRPPTKAELAAGASALKAFIDLFPGARFVAVGRVAASQLPSAAWMRHPASGGAALFRQQIASLLSGLG
jgi:uracil DNA glycosylase superfamily protein